MKTVISLSAVIVWAACAVAQSTPQRQPMDQMHGGCDNYAANLKTEMQLMSMTPIEVTAAADAEGAPPVQTSRALLVDLLPQAQVHFAVQPSQDRGGPDRRAGLLSLGALTPGDWRISVDRFAWIDMSASGRLLPTPSFEMQTGCATIFKTVVFHVPETEPVILQLSGAGSPSVRLLITPAGQNR